MDASIDPTSSKTGGSILGDKTRMPGLAQSHSVYIRPSPAGDTLGGVAAKTRETILLCELAGFELIFVETLGIGQAELVVHSMVDIFLLMAIPGAGDELQGIKRSVTELADLIVVNKADGDNLDAAKLAARQIQAALHLFPAQENHASTEVMLCSALKNKNITEIAEKLFALKKQAMQKGWWQKRRQAQAVQWFNTALKEGLQHHFFNHTAIKSSYEKLQKQVAQQQKSSLAAANELLQRFYNARA